MSVDVGNNPAVPHDRIDGQSFSMPVCAYRSECSELSGCPDEFVRTGTAARPRDTEGKAEDTDEDARRRPRSAAEATRVNPCLLADACGRDPLAALADLEELGCV